MGNNYSDKQLLDTMILETALNAQTDTFFVFDAKTGKAVRWNRAFREISGYTDDEIAELPAPDSYYSPQDLKRAVKFIESLYENNGGMVELDLICKNGDLIPTEYHASIIKDKNGEPQYIVSVGRDITTRRETESIVRDSEERFRSLSNASFDAIFFSDKGVCLEQNATAEKMFGYSSEEAIGKMGTDWIAPEYRDLVMKNMLSGYELPYVVTALRKDGTTFPAEIQGKMSNYKGSAVRVTALRDISERIKIEENLKLSEERLRSMFQNHNAVMLLIHPKTTKIINANKAAEKFYGYTLEELQGMSICDINKHSKIENLRSIAEVLDNKTKFFKFQHTLKNGEKRDVEVHSSPITYEDHTVLFSIIHDISDKITAELQIIENKNKLQRLFDNMSSGFAYHQIVLDENGKPVDYIFLEINSKFEEMTSLKSDQILGKKLTEVIPDTKNDSVDWIDLYGKVALTGKPIKFENFSKAFNKWYHVHAYSPVKGYFATIVNDITDRKRIEEQLEQLSYMVEQSTEGMALADLKGNLIFSNKAWCDMHGYESVNDYLGKNLKIFHSKEQLKKDVIPFNEEVKKLGTFSGEVGHITREGKTFPTFMTSTLLKDRKGNIFGIAGLARDITERKASEMALLESEKRYTDFISHSSEGIYRIEMKNPIPIDLPKVSLIKEINKNAIIAEINDALAEMYGLKAEDLLNKLAISIAPNYGERASLVLEKKNFQVNNIETKDIDKNGDPVYLSETYHGEIEDGKLIRIWGVQRNITEKRIADQALQISEARYRKLFESSKDGNMTLDGPDWKFSSANDATLALFGAKNLDEFMSFAPWELSPPEQPDGRNSKEKARDMIEIAIKEGSNYFEWVHRRVNNEDFYASVLLNRVDLDDSSILLATVRDISEKRNSRLALEESRQRLELALTGANLGLWDINFKTNEVYRSKEWASMLGYDLSEIENTNEFWLSLIHPDDVDSVIYIRDGHEKITDKYFRSEQRLRCKDGSYRWILNWGQIVEHDENGVPLRAVGIHMDIDQRKRAEEDLIKTTSQLKATLESTADGILVVDLKGRMVDFNNQFLKIWKITRDIYPEGKKKDLVSPENAEYAMKHIIGQLTDPQSFIDKVHLLYTTPKEDSYDILTFKDGRVVERYSKPQLIEDNPIGRVWSFRDITEQTNTEKLIRESEMLNRTVIEGSPIGISVRDTTGTLLLANRSWQKLWDLSDEEVSNYKIPRKKLLFNDKDSYLGEHSEKIKKVYTKGGSYEIPELKLSQIRKNKAEWISQVFYAIMNDTGNVDRVVILTTDITQRKKAQLELIEYRNHLEELVKERTTELEKKNKDLEKYNNLFVGREFRIKGLREKVKELEKKLNSQGNQETY